MSTYSQQIEATVKHAVSIGWKQRDTNGGHYQLFAPDGKGIVTTPKSSTDRHALENFMADMKRHGYVAPDDRTAALEKREAKTARTKLLEWLRANPDRVITPQDAILITNTTANNVSMVLAKLWNSGHLIKLQLGQYKLDTRHVDFAANGAATPEPKSPYVDTPHIELPPAAQLAIEDLEKQVAVALAPDEGRRIVDDLLALAGRVEAWEKDVRQREAALADKQAAFDAKRKALLRYITDDSNGEPS